MSAEQERELPYLESMTHKLTIASIYTPQGFQDGDDIAAIHDANCTTCKTHNPDGSERSPA